MNCDLSIESLSAYLDGELNEKERSAAEIHLAVCPRCREVLNALRTIDENVRQGIFEEPSPEFSRALNRRVLDRVRVAPRRSLLRFVPVFAPVAAAIFIFIVLTETSASRRMVSIGDRVAYEEIAPRQEVHMIVPEPELILAPIPAAQRQTAKAAADRVLRAKGEQTLEASTEEARDAVGSMAISSQREAVVRAIIDTNGTIIKVATGNTLISVRDTIMEKELAGQQLSPPLIEGKKTQIYVDFSPAPDEEEDEE
ncbi:zf-HC2 domain-containing protein [candidate division WOR-3 bacterium]|nr:zf-HC2 domain-containing protein [candidate division WOR-3 bacterium]